MRRIVPSTAAAPGGAHSALRPSATNLTAPVHKEVRAAVVKGMRDGVGEERPAEGVATGAGIAGIAVNAGRARRGAVRAALRGKGGACAGADDGEAKALRDARSGTPSWRPSRSRDPLRPSWPPADLSGVPAAFASPSSATPHEGSAFPPAASHGATASPSSASPTGRSAPSLEPVFFSIRFGGCGLDGGLDGYVLS